MRLLVKTLLAAGGAFALHAPLQAEEADVLTRSIVRGDTLTAADFAREDVPGSRSRDALDADAAIGMEAARNLRAGSVLRSRDVVEPRLVRRGDQVSISLRNGALTIGATGRSLDDGARGDRVRVFSETTNRTLEGIVEAPGRIRIAAY